MHSQALPIAAILICFVVMGAWFGVFFGVNFQEIDIHERWIKASCSVIEQTENMYKCCERDCSNCTTCTSGLEPQCDSLNLTIGESQFCCNGYHCCKTCCDTCHSYRNSCSGSKKNRRCHSVCSAHKCNCRCCGSSPNVRCNLSCSKCFKPNVAFLCNTTKENFEIRTNYQIECKKDENCVRSLFDDYHQDDLHLRYINPDNMDQSVEYFEYTVWKMVLLGCMSAAAAGSVIFMLVGLYSYFNNRNGYTKL